MGPLGGGGGGPGWAVAADIGSASIAAVAKAARILFLNILISPCRCRSIDGLKGYHSGKIESNRGHAADWLLSFRTKPLSSGDLYCCIHTLGLDYCDTWSIMES